MKPRQLRWLIAAIAAAALLGIALVIFSSGHTPKGNAPTTVRDPSLSNLSPAQNAALARRLASGMGDRHPEEIATVDSTRGDALKVISPEEQVVGGVAPNAAVRVFAIHGRFIERGPRPPHTGPPTGTWLTVSVDLATGNVLDLSLTDERPDLTPLRRITRLPPSR